MRWRLFSIAAIVTLAVSQAGSYLVHRRLAIDETYVVSSALHFTHIQNTGAVFGWFPGNTFLFAAIGCVIIAGLTL